MTTNDETFRKVLSKLDLTEDDIEDMPLWNDEEGKQVELLPLLKQIGYLSRLATLDDCKTLLERESKAWDMTMGKTPKITPSPHLVIEKALAELEALKLKCLKAKP